MHAVIVELFRRLDTLIVVSCIGVVFVNSGRLVRRVEAETRLGAAQPQHGVVGGLPRGEGHLRPAPRRVVEEEGLACFLRSGCRGVQWRQQARWRDRGRQTDRFIEQNGEQWQLCRMSYTFNIEEMG